MERCRGLVFVLLVTTVATVTALPNPADGKQERDKSIFTEREPRARRQEGRFELTDEENSRLLEALKKTDSAKARELAELRKKNPKRFSEELRKNASDEYDKIVGEHVERWLERRRQGRRNEFIAWLKTNVPQEADALEELKDKNPDLYTRKYEWTYKRYGRAFDESKDHPEMARVLLEDVRLKRTRDHLVGKIKRSESDRDKKRLTAELESVLSDRYDLIVIRKRLLYERLLKRLEGLQKWIRKSRADIEEAKKEEIKAENIRQRTKTLLEGTKKGILD
jgi:hypothetical protein